MMNSQPDDTSSLIRLKSQLSDFRATASPLFPEWTLERLLQQMRSCRRIKGNPIREVYALDTSDGTFFLKLSASLRLKDRWRHRILPHRRWREWRNLHRLRKRQINAARPVLKGERKRGTDQAFFVLTQEVRGSDAGSAARSRAGSLGHFIAALHHQGVYHADLHPANLIVQSNERPCLIDAQAVWFFPWLPRLMRVYNLGRLFWQLVDRNRDPSWWQEFLDAYNRNFSRPVTLDEIRRLAETHRERSYRSRSKRCCKNSSEFVVVKDPELTGYRRREFVMKAAGLEQAIASGTAVKAGRIVRYWPM